ncbi:tetratricopeptide repeat protein [Silvibacterium sp.]|uniref:tetratricopeptide repeat protein n=1 Tax=Silvibacterium sp. TaxID=1964179 RepID=UPI0039E3A451
MREGVLWTSVLGVSLGGVMQAQQTTNQQTTTQQNQQQSPTPSSSQSSAPDANAKKASTPANTAQDNPFPEEQSKKAEAEANKPDSAKTASPADKGFSSSRSNFAGVASPLDSSSRISDGAGGFIHDPKLAEQDVKVGNFYMDRQDFQGAYNRYKEATEIAPENADAVLGLAKSAQALKKTQEAVDNYRIYLDAFPDAKKTKDVRKALAELGAAPK